MWLSGREIYEVEKRAISLLIFSKLCSEQMTIKYLWIFCIIYTLNNPQSVFNFENRVLQNKIDIIYSQTIRSDSSMV